MKRLLLIFIMLCATGLVAGAILADPLLKVAAGFSAKAVCSGVFVSGREKSAVFEEDVRANGHPVLQFVTIARNCLHLGEDSFKPQQLVEGLINVVPQLVVR